MRKPGQKRKFKAGDRVRWLGRDAPCWARGVDLRVVGYTSCTYVVRGDGWGADEDSEHVEFRRGDRTLWHPPEPERTEPDE